ncbi:disulfide bond formation protein DsbA [Virgibacillus indicus]|uniref:Disulfide bond formation protein DsbA n=1 Tax=Virgibacillus indicus TaxID=2024554 RepID=A0A265NAG0_9BACI|nr:DsbA family oxidoreductase [Virgibacillus indicus]OZU88983.1 disulfide bond formation protein DsbA [Virgibacillus indicus]
MKIEVWSDFVCPFCYIGKRRLENAMNDFSNRDAITVEYKSYQLDPTAEYVPGESFYETFSNKKGMPIDQVKAMNQQLKQQAEEVGLDYNFDDMKHANTFDAHRVAKLAAEQGKGKEMTERLLYAYFTESKLISDHATLVELAEEVGLSKEDVEHVLTENNYTKAVQADIDIAQQIGVQGVPFFVFNEKYAVSGAQPPEVFSEVLEKVWEEENEKPVLQSLDPKKSKTSYCTDEGCETK